MKADPDPDHLAEAVDEVGYPLLIKAAAGGGGKGMRVVHGPEELVEAARSCSSEAASSLATGALYLKDTTRLPPRGSPDPGRRARQLYPPGRTGMLYPEAAQKIIEETPSTAPDSEMRQDICESAVKAAQASGYVNAGTVEFLLDDQGNHYFLEVNTRLQVEHPVTEMVTGIDLVRQQILIAAGQPLKYGQEDIKPRGHAIECRIYAEDPGAGFMPSPGRIEYLFEPRGPGLRNDSGATSGSDVPHHYDPIVCKLIAWAEDRDAAIDRMIDALRRYVMLASGRRCRT